MDHSVSVFDQGWYLWYRASVLSRTVDLSSVGNFSVMIATAVSHLAIHSMLYKNVVL